jgi:Cu2+-exporting ATPase
LSLQEDVRPDAAATVAAMKQRGIAVRLLSGDASDAARRVAGRVGIVTIFKGKCSPEGKLDFLRRAKQTGTSGSRG